MNKAFDKNKPYSEIAGGNVPARYEQEGRYYNAALQQVDLKPEHYSAESGPAPPPAPEVVMGGQQQGSYGGQVSNLPGRDQAAGTTGQPGGTRDDTALSMGTQMQGRTGADQRMTMGAGPTAGTGEAAGHMAQPKPTSDQQQVGTGNPDTNPATGPDTGEADARAAVSQRRFDNALKAVGLLEKGQAELIPELADYDTDLLDAMLEVERRAKKRPKVIDALEQELLKKHAEDEGGETGQAGDKGAAPGGDQVNEQLSGG